MVRAASGYSIQGAHPRSLMSFDPFFACSMGRLSAQPNLMQVFHCTPALKNAAINFCLV
jgi:hypothetical protein